MVVVVENDVVEAGINSRKSEENPVVTKEALDEEGR